MISSTRINHSFFRPFQGWLQGSLHKIAALQTLRLSAEPSASLKGKVTFSSTATTMAWVTACALFETDLNIKLCFLRSFFKISCEEQRELENVMENIAVSYLGAGSIPKETSEKVREKFATLAVSSFVKKITDPTNFMHKYFSKPQQIDMACEFLVKCNLPLDSIHLKELLAEIHERTHCSAEKSYSQALLKSEDFEEDEKIQVSVASLKIIEQETDLVKQFSLKEREKMAKEAVYFVLQMIGDDQSDVNLLLQTYCGSDGILRKCNLPEDSDTLKDILSQLDELTNRKASAIYCTKMSNYSHNP